MADSRAGQSGADAAVRRTRKSYRPLGYWSDDEVVNTLYNICEAQEESIKWLAIQAYLATAIAVVALIVAAVR